MGHTRSPSGEFSGVLSTLYRKEIYGNGVKAKGVTPYYHMVLIFPLQEYEIDKTHNIRGPEDVANMGIKRYNELCRGIVSRYANEWETIVTRLGRWIGKFPINSVSSRTASVVKILSKCFQNLIHFGV